MKYPLFKVSRSNCSGTVQVIAADQTQALARAIAVYAEKGIAPIAVNETVTVKYDGTIDYIPSMPIDHIEGK